MMTPAIASDDQDGTVVPRVSPYWQVLAFLLALFVVVLNASSIWQNLTGRQDEGVTGFYTGQCGSDHFCTVMEVTQQSPAAGAGIVAGDLIRYDRGVDSMRRLSPGETQGITVRHDGAERHIVLTATALSPPRSEVRTAQLTQAVLMGTQLLSALIGGLIVLRGGRRASVLLIGAAIACNSLSSASPPVWLSSPSIVLLASIVLLLIFSAAAVLFFAFARQFRLETTGKDGPVLRWIWRVLAIVVAAQTGLIVWLNVSNAPYPFIGSPLIPAATVIWSGFVSAFVTLTLGWRDSRGEMRSRYGILLTAVTLTMLLQVFGIILNMTSNDFSLTNPIAVGYYAAPFMGLVLFAYAVLRHRVIDIGFAVNQTLVYGVVSFIVLMLFGLAEWGVEKALPEDWRIRLEANGAISAVIALAIFLVFHRLRDAVEHVIEGLFFHKWRQNEAELDRFVAKAEHILKPMALKDAAVTEFTRFSGGATVAIYHAEGHVFLRDAGGLDGLADKLDGDLEPLVAMRTDHKPVYAEQAAALKAALVLPMTRRNSLTGFVALGPKPSGDTYRPDERRALADAAERIGADLHALRMSELETALADEAAKSARLEAQVQVLLAMAVDKP